MEQWHPNYQPRDWQVIDYHEWKLPGLDIPFRGPGFDPATVDKGSYFTCIGAAQTYGCLFENPYPKLVSEAIGMPSLNLAVGGAGPGFYTQYQPVIDAMNRGRFVVLQAMSGRSEANSRFAPEGYVEFVKERRTGERVTSHDAWFRIVGEELDQAERYLEETRRSWVESSRKLISMLTVPVIFFWFSRRGHDYTIDYAAVDDQLRRKRAGEPVGFFVEGLVSDFPQVINGAAVRDVVASCAGYAECLSNRGMNQTVYNRFTGEPMKNPDLPGGPEYTFFDYTKNAYYPSAEMHADAAEALTPVIRKVIGI